MEGDSNAIAKEICYFLHWAVSRTLVCVADGLSLWLRTLYLGSRGLWYGKWARKHTVNVLELFGRHCRKDGQYYEMFAFHPDCNVIFLTDEKEMTVSYDMDSQKVSVICTKGMKGMPYTPCFAELQSASH